MQFTFLCLALFIASVHCHPVPGPSCGSLSLALPRQIDQDTQPKKYMAIEAGLQIFLDYKIPCDGFVNEFRFLSGQNNILGLHLAIFREISTDSFRLISQFYVNGSSTNPAEEPWAHIRPDGPMPALTGDFIGIYYDQSVISQGLGSVRLYSPPEKIRGSSIVNSLVFARGAEGLIAEETPLDVYDGKMTYREPALYALLSDVPNERTSIDNVTAIFVKDSGNAQVNNNTASTTPATTFNDFRCSRLPPQMTDICGAETTTRYFFDMQDRTCKVFSGCYIAIPPGDTTPPSFQPNVIYWEPAWYNNFPTLGMCQLTCKDARDVRAQQGSIVARH